MTRFPNLNILKVDEAILMALNEDINGEDVSTNSVVDANSQGEVQLICKEKGILAGMDVFERVFTLLDKSSKVEKFAYDGDIVKEGQIIAKITGPTRVLLSGERVALNFLQRMSGIATYTYKMVEKLKSSNTKLVDTRKTTPNNRIFEKYAVRVGGGKNHRYNLSDGVLLKDNHIEAAGSVKKAIEAAKSYAPFVRKIEIEAETMDMVKEALEAGADIIMLDNMKREEIKEAIELIANRAETESSGNIDLSNIEDFANLGLDYISSGAITHSARIMDLSMKNLKVIT